MACPTCRKAAKIASRSVSGMASGKLSMTGVWLTACTLTMRATLCLLLLARFPHGLHEHGLRYVQAEAMGPQQVRIDPREIHRADVVVPDGSLEFGCERDAGHVGVGVLLVALQMVLSVVDVEQDAIHPVSVGR